MSIFPALLFRSDPLTGASDAVGPVLAPPVRLAIAREVFQPLRERRSPPKQLGSRPTGSPSTPRASSGKSWTSSICQMETFSSGTTMGVLPYQGAFILGTYALRRIGAAHSGMSNSSTVIKAEAEPT